MALCAAIYLLLPREYGDVNEYLAIPQFYVAMLVTIAMGITSLVLIVRGVLRLIKR